MNRNKPKSSTRRQQAAQPSTIHKPDLENFMMHLNTARVLYRAHPELVTGEYGPEVGTCARYSCPCQGEDA